MCALRVLRTLLISWREVTDFRVALRVVEDAVAHRGALLRLCRHPNSELRVLAGAVLYDVLTLVEPAQLTNLQLEILDGSGALLWLLVQSFVSDGDAGRAGGAGLEALRCSRPMPLHFADKPAAKASVSPASADSAPTGTGPDSGALAPSPSPPASPSRLPSSPLPGGFEADGDEGSDGAGGDGGDADDGGDGGDGGDVGGGGGGGGGRAEPGSELGSETASPELKERTLPGIEALADDPELYTAVSYMPYAFVQSSMNIGLLCHLASGSGDERRLGVSVRPDGVEIFADDAAESMACTCNVHCERETLMQVLRGERDAMGALMAGQLLVDDLGQLMALKMCFTWNRAAFEAFVKRKERAASAAAAAVPDEGASKAEHELTLSRTLVALLCDDAAHALALLARVAPPPFVSRYLARAPPPPMDASAVLAALTPADLGRVRSLPRAERDRFCRAVWASPRRVVKRQKQWHKYWQAMASDHLEDEVIWSARLIEPLQRSCAQELANFERRRALAPADREPPLWDHASFSISYAELATHLQVELDISACVSQPEHVRTTSALRPLYIRPLLSRLHMLMGPRSARGGPPPTPLPLEPSATVERLWQRLVISQVDAERPLLLDAVAAVYAVYGAEKPALTCMPFLAHLLTHRADSALITASVLGVLVHAFKCAANVRDFLAAVGLEPISKLLLGLPLHPPLVSAALDAGRTPAAEAAAPAATHAPRPPPLASAQMGVEGQRQLAVALAAIDLLQSACRSSARVARELCSWPHLPRIAQAVLCGNSAIIHSCSELLGMLADQLPPLASVVHACGAFHFLLATIPPSSGELPAAAAHFLKQYHDTQAADADGDGGAPAAGASILAPYLPPQLLLLLVEARRRSSQARWPPRRTRRSSGGARRFASGWWRMCRPRSPPSSPSSSAAAGRPPTTARGCRLTCPSAGRLAAARRSHTSSSSARCSWGACCSACSCATEASPSCATTSVSSTSSSSRAVALRLASTSSSTRASSARGWRATRHTALAPPRKMSGGRSCSRRSSGCSDATRRSRTGTSTRAPAG